MRLIDADAVANLLRDDIDGLEKEFPNDKEAQACKCGEGMALAYIDTAPTIDAVPVRHGIWIDADVEEPRRYACSECKRLAWMLHNYCPNCGARMDGEDNETD